MNMSRHVALGLLGSLFFGRDLSQQQLVNDSMDILQARIQALTEMYN
jgi:hypothetical protein